MTIADGGYGVPLFSLSKAGPGNVGRRRGLVGSEEEVSEVAIGLAVEGVEVGRGGFEDGVVGGSPRGQGGVEALDEGDLEGGLVVEGWDAEEGLDVGDGAEGRAARGDEVLEDEGQELGPREDVEPAAE
eukprot:CAMPEP_0118900340 /NCGR_PEP_ID=MMETSP1166-20130328/6495_1 /TAXON_ID=1104430 /ORGANISM="Chrysoreinhardia sp, Strain CCMP3193" /LENGTH=128 /DNA_ID=CAMNT_0006839479 /DNA_START=49 /DNA_END=432 /DNA_ORIENTATION=-